MHKLGVFEPAIVKEQVVKAATEAATMILRIDDVIAAKLSKPPAGAGGAGGKPPSGEGEGEGSTPNLPE